jgi:hypothetical protein
MGHLSIYLDESGDLGFDHSKIATSEYFVVTLLVCKSLHTTKAIKKAVIRTIKNKLNHRKNKKRIVQELKGTLTTLQIKQYFFNQCPKAGWELYSVILNKKKIKQNINGRIGKQKLYNFITKFLIEKIDFPQTTKTVNLVLDKCKNNKEIKDFNLYLETQLKSSLPNLDIILDINHKASHEIPELQAVDLFCWGIARKKSHHDTRWYDTFKDKIKLETVYLN